MASDEAADAPERAFRLLSTALPVLSAWRSFPSMSSGAVVDFGAILLFGYAVALPTGFVPGTR